MATSQNITKRIKLNRASSWWCGVDERAYCLSTSISSKIERGVLPNKSSRVMSLANEYLCEQSQKQEEKTGVLLSALTMPVSIIGYFPKYTSNQNIEREKKQVYLLIMSTLK
jgi:hypothetical protein